MMPLRLDTTTDDGERKLGRGEGKVSGKRGERKRRKKGEKKEKEKGRDGKRGGINEILFSRKKKQLLCCSLLRILASPLFSPT